MRQPYTIWGHYVTPAPPLNGILKYIGPEFNKIPAGPTHWPPRHKMNIYLSGPFKLHIVGAV